MATATRTTNHDEIRSWAEERGGIPTIVKGTDGLLRIDFVEGAKSGGREDSLEEVSWDRWFELFDDNGLSFLHSPEEDSKFFKLVFASKAERERSAQASASGGRKGGGARQEQPSGGGRREGGWNVVLVAKEEDEGWVVELEGDGHRKAYHTKSEAVHHARELARRHQPAELVIEKVDGDEEDVVHYGDPSQHAPR